MKYRNAKDVFPNDLLVEIQKYVGEELIYFSPNGQRKKWGSKTGRVDELRKRNLQICFDYENGSSLDELSTKYWLSVYTLKKIIYVKDK